MHIITIIRIYYVPEASITHLPATGRFLICSVSLLYRSHFTLSPSYYFTARILLLWALKPIYINVGPETHVHKITNAPVFLWSWK